MNDARGKNKALFAAHKKLYAPGNNDINAPAVMQTRAIPFNCYKGIHISNRHEIKEHKMADELNGSITFTCEHRQWVMVAIDILDLTTPRGNRSVKLYIDAMEWKYTKLCETDAFKALKKALDSNNVEDAGPIPLTMEDAQPIRLAIDIAPKLEGERIIEQQNTGTLHHAISQTSAKPPDACGDTSGTKTTYGKHSKAESLSPFCHPFCMNTRDST